MLIGQVLAPFRLLRPAQAVLPLRSDRIMTEAEVAEPEGLSAWWAQVEDQWRAHRKPNETKPLLERMDFHGQLSAQLPAASQRVVYTASGSTLIAARVVDPTAVIEHKLFWAAVSSPQEALYLVAVLNSSVLLDRVRPLQSKGLFGPRDFDKHVFRIPIPTFDRGSELHAEIADLAATAEEVALAQKVDDSSVQAARRMIRSAIDDAGVTARLEESIDQLLPAM